MAVYLISFLFVDVPLFVLLFTNIAKTLDMRRKNFTICQFGTLAFGPNWPSQVERIQDEDQDHVDVEAEEDIDDQDHDHGDIEEEADGLEVEVREVDEADRVAQNGREIVEVEDILEKNDQNREEAVEADRALDPEAVDDPDHETNQRYKKYAIIKRTFLFCFISRKFFRKISYFMDLPEKNFLSLIFMKVLTQ